MEGRYSLDQQAVLKAIPDFLDLPIDEAMQRFDELISDGSIRLASISYSPQMHWSLGRHCREYPVEVVRQKRDAADEACAEAGD